MSDAAKPVFLVDPSSDPVTVRIEGRASFLNSACLSDFFKQMVPKGKTSFVIDFGECSSMDSTFLGVLAGAALQVRKATPCGRLILRRVGPRNLELVRNLGLHRLLTIDSDGAPNGVSTAQPLGCEPRSRRENTRLVLEAHENLVAADGTNREKFEDVLTYLRKQEGLQGEAS